MADALWNDIIYTDVLQSDGFVIDYAVCTTYSLDMPSLLSVPFMLGTMTDLTETIMRSPHLILETINQSAGKFAVFCNAGCMAVPQANSKVYSLLEQSVVQVTLQAKGGGSSQSMDYQRNEPGHRCSANQTDCPFPQPYRFQRS